LEQWPSLAGTSRWAAWADALRAAEGLEPDEELSNAEILEHARKVHAEEVAAIEAEYAEAVIDALAGEILDAVDPDADPADEDW
jgi:hypothetical protein